MLFFSVRWMLRERWHRAPNRLLSLPFGLPLMMKREVCTGPITASVFQQSNRVKLLISAPAERSHNQPKTPGVSLRGPQASTHSHALGACAAGHLSSRGLAYPGFSWSKDSASNKTATLMNQILSCSLKKIKLPEVSRESTVTQSNLGMNATGVEES